MSVQGIPLVHYPKLSNGPILDDERWLPANRRAPTHIAFPVAQAARLIAAEEEAKEMSDAFTELQAETAAILEASDLRCAGWKDMCEAADRDRRACEMGRARLIDPTDPQVREIIERTLRRYGAQAGTPDAIIAALKESVPPAAQRREPDGTSDTGAMREPSGGTDDAALQEGNR